jgi:predicted ATPase
LAEIGRLLTETECRLLTLTGPGGVGKTRLALQAAAEHLDTFVDGVFFISLASLSAADLLPRTIAFALGVESTTADVAGPLLAHLRHKEMLLLLDNFEHLLAESGATALLTRVLMQAPEVTLLVTSRERLNLQGEWLFTVAGFPTIVENQDDSDAIQLFVQSARRVAPGFMLSPTTPVPQTSRIAHAIISPTKMENRATIPADVTASASWLAESRWRLNWRPPGCASFLPLKLRPKLSKISSFLPRLCVTYRNVIAA